MDKNLNNYLIGAAVFVCLDDEGWKVFTSLPSSSYSCLTGINGDSLTGDTVGGTARVASGQVGAESVLTAVIFLMPPGGGGGGG